MSAESAESFLNASFDLTEAIVRAASELRDETFANEYAMTHFTYRTRDNQKYAASVKTRIGNADAHRLQGQEAEYILYGLPSCQMNLTAMHTELFALRTGMRTLEAMLDPKKAPVRAAATPMVALITALAEGAKEANDDVDKLLAGEAVELPFVPAVTMNYKDHLRLFYLLHSRDESILSRMQALIELNTGIDLTQRYTALRVIAEPAVGGSWWLPAVQRRAEIVESY